MQNAVVRLVVNQPKQGHVNPLLIEVHLLTLAALIKFMKTYGVLVGSVHWLKKSGQKQWPTSFTKLLKTQFFTIQELVIPGMDKSMLLQGYYW